MLPPALRHRRPAVLRAPAEAPDNPGDLGCGAVAYTSKGMGYSSESSSTARARLGGPERIRALPGSHPHTPAALRESRNERIGRERGAECEHSCRQTGNDLWQTAGLRRRARPGAVGHRRGTPAASLAPPHIWRSTSTMRVRRRSAQKSSALNCRHRGRRRGPGGARAAHTAPSACRRRRTRSGSLSRHRCRPNTNATLSSWKT